MTVTMNQRTKTAKDPRKLVPPEVWGLLVEDLRRTHHVTRDYAERMMGQALVFLKAQASIVRARREGRPWERIVPTSPVDPAWHAFILRSQAYGDFCQEHAGEFIHHVPYQDEAMLNGAALEATIPQLEATGYRVDVEWAGAGQERERTSKTDTLDLNSPDRPPVRTVDWLIKSPRLAAAVHVEPQAACDWLIGEWDRAREKAMTPVPEWVRGEGRAARALRAIETGCWPSCSQWLTGGTIVFLAVVGTDRTCH